MLQSGVVAVGIIFGHTGHALSFSISCAYARCAPSQAKTAQAGANMEPMGSYTRVARVGRRSQKRISAGSPWLSVIPREDGGGDAQPGRIAPP